MIQEKVTNCPLCKSKNISLYCKINHSVASDASIIPKNCVTYLCSNCLNLFKVRNKADFDVISSIYETYILHSKGQNNEQRVAYDIYPEGITKSEHIANYILENVNLSETGNLLDFGCHFGSFLKKLFQSKKKWNIHGFDISYRFEEDIKNISSKAKYICKKISNIDNKYELITIIHVLEHLLDPINTLLYLKNHLSEGGILFLQSNNTEENPFLPFLFEQHYNYSIPGIINIFNMVGLHIKNIRLNWIPKEFTIIAQKKKNDIEVVNDLTTKKTIKKINKNKTLLNDTILSLNKIEKGSKKIGILGTAYVGKWIAHNIPDKFDFFVDENPFVQGKIISSKPVIAINDIPDNSCILVALPPEIAMNFIKRFKNKVQCNLIPPPFI